MMEAGLVLDVYGNPIFEHFPPGRSSGSLPDSRDLWDFIWDNRHQISGFAHSHPGNGIPYPSDTDITTFKAIEAALGRRLDWWIISSDSIILVKWIDNYVVSPIQVRPAWFFKLKELSGM
ncbi:MAG TPA: hypothetical protein VIE65_15350 [Methylobacter sp.]|jgi:hypothetical protein